MSLTEIMKALRCCNSCFGLNHVTAVGSRFYGSNIAVVSKECLPNKSDDMVMNDCMPSNEMQLYCVSATITLTH